jgi:hypothetical protein
MCTAVCSFRYLCNIQYVVQCFTLRTDHLVFGLSFKLSISKRNNCALFCDEFSAHISNILSILTFASSSSSFDATFFNGFFCVLCQSSCCRHARYLHFICTFNGINHLSVPFTRTYLHTCIHTYIDTYMHT